jgi:hypothetical protein
MKTLFLALLVLLVAGDAAARGTVTVDPDKVSGIELYKWCTPLDANPQKLAWCQGYFMSYLHFNEAIRTSLAQKIIGVCIPRSVRLPRLIEVFLDYIEGSPGRYESSAWQTITASTREEWPCRLPPQR